MDAKYSLSFQCVRKHFLRDKKYTLYLYPDVIKISEKYSIPLNFDNLLAWKVEGQEIVAFGIRY